eukprot:2888248-Amphidinium_carterae.1
MHPPTYAHLGTFFRCIVAPLANLFRVVPFAAIRRNGESSIRVPYVAASGLLEPVGLVTGIEQFDDLRHALSFAAFTGYCYIALAIGNLLVKDKDADTNRGIAVRHAFQVAAKFVNQRLLYGVVSFTIALFDSHHFVCVIRPAVSVEVALVAEQVCQLMNELFQLQRKHENMRHTGITFSVDLPKCGFAQGGTRSSTSSRSSSPSACTAPWPILFRTDTALSDPIGTCVLWVLKASRGVTWSTSEPLQLLRSIVASWLRASVKRCIPVAGIYIAQLAQWWNVDIDTCVDRICQEQTDRDLAVLFVYAAGCLLQVQCVVIDASGQAEGGFVHTRGFGLLHTSTGWVVVAPFNDSECILNMLTSHGSISSTLEYVTLQNAKSENSLRHPPLAVVTGGAIGGTKRKCDRSVSPPPSGSEQDAGPTLYAWPTDHQLYWPPWQHIDDDETLAFHLSVEHSPPVEIIIPAIWTRDEAERAFASHLAVCMEWIDFTWVDADVSIEASSEFPQVDSSEWCELCEKIQVMHVGPQRRRTLTAGSETIIGHRASRLRGLTSYTLKHEASVRDLVAFINAFIPRAVYNAAAIVTHGSTPAHRDSTNDPSFNMVVIPRRLAEGSWLWIESTSGTAAIQYEQQELLGSWFPFSRTFSFAAGLTHQVHSPHEMCASLVLYRTLRTPRRTHLLQLAQFGFPLSLAELDLMAEPPEDAEDSPPEISEEERECSVSDADSVCHIRSLPGAFPRDVEKIAMLKVKRDGSLRRIFLHIEPDSTVDQAILILKKYLKLNPARIFIARGLTPADCQVLPGDHTISASGAPYIIKVQPQNATAPKCAISAHATAAPPRHPDKLVPQTVIGAKISKPQNKIARTIHRDDRAQVPLPGAASGSGHQPQPCSEDNQRPVPRSSFERWVMDKLLTLEQCQSELRAEVDQLKQTLPLWTSTPAASSTRRSTAIGARQLVHGGGRVQKVQLDTVARSAQLTFSKDLAFVHCHLLNDKLVRHLFNADKKCTLAVFQARSRAQRFQAVIAALRRMGMDELARSLPSDGLDERADDLRAADLPVCRPSMNRQAAPQPYDAHADATQSNLARLVERVDAIETWAHSLDCVDGENASLSGSRVRAYLEQLVQQVWGSHGSHGVAAADLEQAQDTLQKRVDAQLLDLRQRLQQPPTEPLHEDALVALKLHLEQKVDEVVTQRLSSAKHEQEETVFIPLGMARCVPQPADGRCMYHALAAGLADGTSASMLQAELMQHMHSQQISGVSLHEWKSWESSPSVGDSAAPSLPSHWGGAVELASVASARGARIRVFQKDTVNGVEGHRVIATFGSKGAGKLNCIDLLYSAGNHYDLLIVPDDNKRSASDLQMQDIKAKLAKVEHQLDLCMRLCRRTIIGASQLPAQVTKKVADHARILQQTSELIRMHTIAITRNWQWTASFVHAGTQGHSAVRRAASCRTKPVFIDGAASPATAAPPPPPPPPLPTNCQFSHQSIGVEAVETKAPLPCEMQHVSSLTQEMEPTTPGLECEHLLSQQADAVENVNVTAEPTREESEVSVDSRTGGERPETELGVDHDLAASSGTGNSPLPSPVYAGVAYDPLVISDTE